MSEVFTIEQLLNDKDLRASRRYGMEGIAAEYLHRMHIVGNVLEDRRPTAQFLAHLDAMKEDDPLIEEVAKERMLFAAGGFMDPGDESVRNELLEERARLSQQTEV